jgi:hypothetical protein
MKHFVSIVRQRDQLHMMIDADPSVGWFNHALLEWELFRAADRPICLTCHHEFKDSEPLPKAFFFFEVGARKKGPPDRVNLTGICDKCALRTDAELRHAGLSQLGAREVEGGVFTFDDDGAGHGEESPVAGSEPQHRGGLGDKPKASDENSDDET